ncbi:AMP-binding protein [Sulfurovum sp. zt1-1]|uniref:AMP-binding protein n=1 Tax=Sulfurovum zhangzhouensis TaxID=3019067 RepID=A0ABT7QYK7_9BACT|nr:AMP-binding protein [Sulfurovum zhangzhouensis]MDM5271882.1 AMP-binding protein [Sulfurovum zhangzhouensis]
MNSELLEKIRKHHQMSEGREKLFYDLAGIESKIWEDIESQMIINWSTLFSQIAAKARQQIVITEVDTQASYSYSELEDASEKIKAFILATTDDHHIGLHYHNSFAFMAALIGINKAGRIAILFNNREPQDRLITLAETTSVKTVLGDPVGDLERYEIEKIMLSEQRYHSRYGIHTTTLDDPAFVIFTSGTSGPSKPALFSHRRMIGAGVAWGLRTGMDSSDSCYIALPLYHGNGLAVAFSAVVFSGARSVLRPKFSVTHFWDDINRYGCTHMVYIGELWRYLRTTDDGDMNPNTSLKVIFGNGLNKTLWEEVIRRYGIEHVVEHFGATEMPAGALTNWFDIPGYCGYLPPDDPKAQEMVLVDEDLKTNAHRGEALFVVPSGKYRGYMDESLDERKLVRNLFTKGDLWWRSGDLLERNEEGFFTFIERMGDTYRFKGENVACVDVEEAIRSVGKFDEVVVYGITLPHVDGKIGMASLVSSKFFGIEDANALYENLKDKVASYALPYILRVQKEKHHTTSTLKIQKAHLAKEGIERFKELQHYILLDGGYQPLDEQTYKGIIEGKIVLGIKGKR